MGMVQSPNWPDKILNPDVADLANVVNNLNQEISESQQSAGVFSLHPEELNRWERAIRVIDTMIQGIVGRGSRMDMPASTPQPLGVLGESDLAGETPNPFLNRFIRLFNQLIESLYRSQSSKWGRDFHPADIERWRNDLLAEGLRLIAEYRSIIESGGLDFPETGGYNNRVNAPQAAAATTAGTSTTTLPPLVAKGQ